MSYGECGREREEARRRRAGAAAPGPAACLCSPLSAQPGMAGDSSLAWGVGGLSSLPLDPQSSGGSSPHQGWLRCQRLCGWQLKISSARRRYLVIFSLTASHLSLLGSTVGRRGQEDPASPGRRRGFGSHCPHSAPTGRAAISEAGQWILTPHLFLSPLLGGETSRGGG